jgi:hypothetical protein
MPKLTVQFLIEGNRVDAIEAEQPSETDLRRLIDALKDCLSECVDDLDPEVEAAFARLIEDARERREREGGK